MSVFDRGPTLILAPHAGGIEPGTSELAHAIAGDNHSLYLFEGFKRSGNKDLHITSSNFDEPRCLAILERAARVVTVHGERRDGDVVFVGGLDEVGIDRIRRSLVAAGFLVKEPDSAHLKGTSKANVCNRGKSGVGVQLELMEGLRRSFFRTLTPRSERKHRTQAFERFASALRDAIKAD